jgi:hypothetical protein
MRRQLILATLFVTTCGSIAMAQATPDQPATVKQRKENQQDRIAQGVNSGQLTAGETSKLEDKEAALNQEVNADRKANGGTLTPAEKAQVQKQQNSLSKQIYADKHNATQAQYGSSVVGQRKENQQDRIAQGVNSGQLTAGEAAKLEDKEAAVNQQVSADRKANGGTLTPAEKTQVQQQQNSLSKQIYTDKHNPTQAQYGNSVVGQRKENQQDRIAQGVNSGQLTAGETTKLEDRESALNQEIGADRKANGGTLTPAEKTQVQQQQNSLSQQIYTDKHNATQAQSGNSVVGQRRENQQDRIAQGIQSGSLTPGQTANLENNERALNGEVAADRNANGGTLTPAEKTQVQQQQNSLSKQIYTDKHNATQAQYGNSVVGQRKENQQDRIAQGVNSGQLTAGETTKLEDRESALNQEIGADRKANGGTLTPAEKTQVQQQQNSLSQQVYTDKHNATQAQYGNSVVGQRRENQQDRIAQGIQSGSLTPGQTAKLENNQRALNGEVAADRAANGGRLTKAEKAKVNRQQNHLSKQIYKKKHV